MLSCAPNAILNSVRLSLNALCASRDSLVGRKPHTGIEFFDSIDAGLVFQMNRIFIFVPYPSLRTCLPFNLAFYRRLCNDRTFNKFQNKDSISLLFRVFD